METHLSPREEQVVSLIGTIKDRPEFPTIAEMAEAKLGITSTNTAALLDKLLKKGVLGRDGTRRKYKYFVTSPLPLTPITTPVVKAESVAKPKPVAKVEPKPVAAPKPKPAATSAIEPAFLIHDPDSVRELIATLVDRVEALNTEVQQLKEENQRLSSRKQMDYYTPNLVDRMRALGINVVG